MPPLRDWRRYTLTGITETTEYRSGMWGMLTRFKGGVPQLFAIFVLRLADCSFEIVCVYGINCAILEYDRLKHSQVTGYRRCGFIHCDFRPCQEVRNR